MLSSISFFFSVDLQLPEYGRVKYSVKIYVIGGFLNVFFMARFTASVLRPYKADIDFENITRDHVVC
jgi:hypothetical protein